jgi:hypothetical protein
MKTREQQSKARSLLEMFCERATNCGDGIPNSTRALGSNAQAAQQFYQLTAQQQLSVPAPLGWRHDEMRAGMAVRQTRLEQSRTATHRLEQHYCAEDRSQETSTDPASRVMKRGSGFNQHDNARIAVDGSRQPVAAISRKSDRRGSQSHAKDETSPEVEAAYALVLQTHLDGRTTVRLDLCVIGKPAIRSARSGEGTWLAKAFLPWHESSENHHAAKLSLGRSGRTQSANNIGRSDPDRGAVPSRGPSRDGRNKTCRQGLQY